MLRKGPIPLPWLESANAWRDCPSGTPGLGGNRKGSASAHYTRLEGLPTRLCSRVGREVDHEKATPALMVGGRTRLEVLLAWQARARWKPEDSVPARRKGKAGSGILTRSAHCRSAKGVRGKETRENASSSIAAAAALQQQQQQQQHCSSSSIAAAAALQQQQH